jgi:hypothetical protein
MAKDIRLVCARYERAVRVGFCAHRADRDVDKQARHYNSRYEKRAVTETMVRQVLMEHGVSVILIVHYLNFGRHMAKLAEHYGGASLRAEAAAAVWQWTRKGLAQPVLEDICRTVFNVSFDTPVL